MLDSGGCRSPDYCISPAFPSLKNKFPKLENYTAGSVFLKTDIIFFVKFLTTPQFHISLKSAHKIYSLPSFFSRGFNLLKSLHVNIFFEMQHFPGYDSTVKETYVINGTQEEGLRLTI